MPVLMTIAAVTFLFSRGSNEKPGFLSPTALREKLENLPEGRTREEAIAIADELDALAREYDEATDTAMSRYVEDVEDWNSASSDLIEDMQPMDQARGNTLPELIRLRQRLVVALSPDEWDEVFS